jgi:hypothetical protein
VGAGNGVRSCCALPVVADRVGRFCGLFADCRPRRWRPRDRR